MKKIIVALDGLKYSRSARDHAIHLAKMHSAHLVGVFLEDFTYTGYKIYDLVKAEGGLVGSARKRFDKLDSKQRSKSRENFEDACQKAGLEYSVHRDRSIAIQELLHESIYADLIIIDIRETLTHYPEKIPTSFIRDLLSQAQCPVLVVPPIYKEPEKAILLYDGGPTSVHAIKMFSYTLPEFKNFKVEIICIKPTSRNRHLPDNKLMKEFIKRHFPGGESVVLNGDAETEIVKYLKAQKVPAIVVLGAYRRGTVSRWFKESMADVIMKEIKVPLFIAHNK